MSLLDVQKILDVAGRIAKSIGAPAPNLGVQGGEVGAPSVDFQSCFIEMGEPYKYKRTRHGETLTAPAYVVATLHITPAVHYYRDGSVQPEDVDVVEILRTRSLGEAIKRAFTYDIERAIDNALEAEGERELYDATQQLLREQQEALLLDAKVYEEEEDYHD